MNTRVIVAVALAVLALIPAVAAEALLPINAGWNLVSLPANYDSISMEGLMLLIDTQIPGECRVGYRWNGAGYDVHPYGTGTNNFFLIAQQGYWLFCDAVIQNAFIEIPGTAFPDTTTLDLTAGFNLISIPINIGPRDIVHASDILTQANEQGVDASIMYNWNGAGYDVAIHQNGQVMGNNFKIENGHGYWLFTNNAGTVAISK